MKGYILSCTNNTNDWIAYENDMSLDYKEFLKGQVIGEKEPSLFFDVPRKSNLGKVKSALVLESSGPTLVSERLKKVLGALSNSLQFFEVELLCEMVKIEGFYALNIPFKIPCIDMEQSEYRLMNFDPNNPDYMFYYMAVKENIFTEYPNLDVVLCEEMPRHIVVNERVKSALFDANMKGLKFSTNIDITPQERTVYEIV